MNATYLTRQVTSSSTNTKLSPVFLEMIKIECRYCTGEGVYRGLKRIEDPCENCRGKGWEFDISQAYSGTGL